MRGTRSAAGWIGLALMLALAGCGQADPQAELVVSSVPAAEIYVDGQSHGMSPATIGLTAGEHQVELRLAKFESFATQVLVTANQTAQIDAALIPQDPSDPDVIAVLAEANGIDVAPFIAPELTRGRSGKRTAAVLLWPSRDVRQEGLVSFAIEADESYGGDAALEFRQGRKVLHREPFNPESVTTIRSLPATVVEAAQVNKKITWGLYYEDRRRPITAEFRIVKRNKADKQLEKLASSRHVARQPEITQQILQATVLENNRLYTEALVMNLSIAANHPGSTQPYRGIVTTLRRLDAENSELFAFVAPNVSGRGGRSGISARGSAGGLDIGAWAPVQPASTVPTPKAPEATTPQATAQPGVTPPAQPTAPGAAAEEVPTPGAPVDPQAQATRDQLSVLTAEQERTQQQFEEVSTQLQGAAERVNAASERADQAQAAADAAREALINQAGEPTPEQHEALAQAEAAAQEARQAAADAAHEASQVEAEANRLADALQARNQAIEGLQQVLEQAGSSPVPTPEQPAVPPTADQTEAFQRDLEDAQSGAEEARGAVEAAQARLDAARAAYEADPSPANQADLDAASTAIGSATQLAEQAQANLAAAEQALARIGDPSQVAPQQK